MFRKPKKNPKAKFRDRKKIDEGQGRTVSVSRLDGELHKDEEYFRKRSFAGPNDSTYERGIVGREGEEEQTTSEILEQIRKEKSGGGAKKRRQSPKLIEGGGDGARGVMHEFRTADPAEQLSAADMATRAAEHHPVEKLNPGEEQNLVDGRINTDDSGRGDADGVYRGSSQPRNKFLAGPMKAPTFVRTTCRFDYQPDICKDYKDTGFCGFGDTCIYLHDRGDTMTGWQMEQQWEEKKKKEREKKEKEMDRFLQKASDSHVDNDSDEDNAATIDDTIPFACHICRGPFRDPVVTSCGHYFCEGCIMGQVKGDAGGGAEASSACPICGKNTHSVFNHPPKLVAKKRRVIGANGTWESFAKASR